jgi:hypothetical protein
VRGEGEALRVIRRDGDVQMTRGVVPPLGGDAGAGELEPDPGGPVDRQAGQDLFAESERLVGHGPEAEQQPRGTGPVTGLRAQVRRDRELRTGQRRALQVRRDPACQLGPLRRCQLVEHGVAGERVPPVEGVRVAGAEQARLDGRPHAGRRVLVTGGRRDEPPVQFVAQQRRRADQRPRRLGQPAYPTRDEPGERSRHPGPQRPVGAPHSAVVAQPAGLDEATGEVGDQQRQPAGRSAQIRHGLGVHRSACTFGGQRCDVCVVEPAQRQPAGVPADGVQRGRAALVVAGGQDERHRRRACAEVRQEVERVPVRPVQVVEHEYGPSLAGDHLQEHADGLAEHDRGVDEMRHRRGWGRRPPGEQAGEHGGVRGECG